MTPSKKTSKVVDYHTLFSSKATLGPTIINLETNYLSQAQNKITQDNILAR